MRIAAAVASFGFLGWLIVGWGLGVVRRVGYHRGSSVPAGVRNGLVARQTRNQAHELHISNRCKPLIPYGLRRNWATVGFVRKTERTAVSGRLEAC
jgi:hypothetical protein